MGNNTVLFFLFIYLSFITQSQENLVPNGSFEEYDTCPYDEGQINFSIPWFSPTNNTPDYFNACSSNFNVPNASTGYQLAYEGHAYIGMYLSLSSNSECEYIAVKLKEKLQKDASYCFSFQVNLANLHNLNCSIQKIGIYFSQDSIHQDNMGFLPYNPKSDENILSIDTSSWFEVKGYYSANGDEQYFYIGNFDKVNNIISCNNSINSDMVYVYIDNVSITQSSECDILSDIQLPNVITSNLDGVNDIVNIPVDTEVQTFVFNRRGNLISSFSGNTVFWDGTNHGVSCSNGVYYMIERYKMNGKQKEKQTFIHLLH